MKKYSKKRYITLVNDLVKSKKEGVNWYQKNPLKYRELLKYQSILEDYFYWLNRKNFILLMEDFVNNSVNFEQFEINFSKLWRETLHKSHANALDLRLLNTIEPDPRSSGFSRFPTCIYHQFEELEDEYCTKDDIKSNVEEILAKIEGLN